jgi:hypothetical protein
MSPRRSPPSSRSITPPSSPAPMSAISGRADVARSSCSWWARRAHECFRKRRVRAKRLNHDLFRIDFRSKSQSGSSTGSLRQVGAIGWMRGSLIPADILSCRWPSNRDALRPRPAGTMVGLASRRALAILFAVRLGKVSLSRVLPTRYLCRCRLSSAPAFSIKIRYQPAECELSHT